MVLQTIKKYILLTVLCAVATAKAQTGGECLNNTEYELFTRINEMRNSEGLTPFTYSYHLTHGALEQNKRLAKNPDSEYQQLSVYSPAYTAIAFPFDIKVSKYYTAQSLLDQLFIYPERKASFFDKDPNGFTFNSMGLSIENGWLYVYLGVKEDNSAEMQRCAEEEKSTQPATYNWILMPALPYVKLFESEGTVSVRMGYYNWGFIDSTGKMQIPAEYHGNTWFTKGLACVIMDEKAALINHQNEMVVPYGKYNMIVLDENYPRMVLQEGDKQYLADNDGNILSAAYEEVNISGNGFYSFYLNDKKGIMDINGKVVFPPKYEEIERYEEGFYPFQQGGKWGFMDKNFNVKIAPKYGGPVAYAFFKGLSHYSVNNKVGFMDTTGKIVLPAIYDEAGMFNDEGHCMVSLKGKFGVIDRTGKFIIPAQYENIQRDQLDDNWIVKKDGLYGILGNNNQWKLQPEFEEMYFLKSKRYLVQSDLSWGMISVNF